MSGIALEFNDILSTIALKHTSRKLWFIRGRREKIKNGTRDASTLSEETNQQLTLSSECRERIENPLKVKHCPESEVALLRW